ncbi:uncharacterized protein LOC144667296 [Oculina patagonica]
MAASVDVNSSDELNSILKTLAGRDKEAEIYKKYNDFFTGSLLPQLSSTSNKSEVDGDYVKMWAYGSAAEDLQSFDHCDAGDMDFMIFPNLDEMIIREEMLEYSLENPLHVTIKGGDNLVLQSCLVENSEYVATSALKNFHPAIFGSKAPTYTLISLLSFFARWRNEVRFYPFLTYHRAYLSTQPKSLVSFHLKNIFLQTIEETGAGVWTESNRAECMMKLLGNLLKALIKKNLRQFFVRSYNLFDDDYIENPEILESLAGKAEEIMGNPVRFAKQLILKQEDAKECKEEKDTAKEHFSFAKPVPRQQQTKTEGVSSEGNYATQWKKGSATVPLPKQATQGSDPPEHRFHDLVPSVWNMTRCARRSSTAALVFTILCIDLDNLMNREELLEYSFENPLHVRIRGGDHPVLQSCLVDDTEYVATSALKNFCPAIFGSSSSFLVDFLSLFCQLMPRDDLQLGFTARLKNNATSPAVTLNMSQLLGSSIYEYWEMLKVDSLNVPIKKAAAEVEYIVHFFPSTTKGDSAENSHRLTEIPMSKEVTERQAVESNCKNIEMNEDCNVEENQSKTNRKSLDQTGELTHKDLPCNLDSKEEKEKIELGRRFCRLVDILCGKMNEKMVTKSKDTGKVTSGADFLPAFRSRGWPKVAKEWIKRERKWPSPNVVEKVILEGFHLVVKPPKSNSSPECDFRISFSHAEYLLSQEMNDIQRECYRCLKRYYRAYLSTQPKSLVSFHLKNIFLQTIEETGAEMWTENNRGECMMKVFGNLLEALAKKELRHFFVRSYNLFGEDYIENSEILESLVSKVQEIMENPVQFAKQLVQSQEETKKVKKEEYVSKKKIPSSESSLCGKLSAGQRHEEIEEIKSKRSRGSQCTKEKVKVPLRPTETTQECCPVYRYHDLHDIFQEVTKKLFDVAFDDTDNRLETREPLERTLVEDRRELEKKCKIPVEVFPRVFDTFWHKRVYYWVWISTEADVRHRVLVAIQGAVEILKYSLKKDDFWQAVKGEGLESLVDRMLDHSEGKLSDTLPPASFIQFLHKFANTIAMRNQPRGNLKRSSEKNLGDLVMKYFKLSGPEELFDFWENVLSLLSNDPGSTPARVQGVVESMKRFALKDDHLWEGNARDILEIFFDLMISESAQPNKQALNNEALENLHEMFFDLIKRTLNSYSACLSESKVVSHTDNIP